MSGMAIHVRLSDAARRQGVDAFWRCGLLHTRDGAAFGPDFFTPEEWARLRADPLLEVTEGAPVPDAAALLDAAIAGAIRDLSAGDYSRGGKPNVGPIRERMPDDAEAVTRARVDAVFGQMCAGGFEPPAAKAPQEG